MHHIPGTWLLQSHQTLPHQVVHFFASGSASSEASLLARRSGGEEEVQMVSLL